MANIKEMVEHNTIIRATVGSTCLGLSLPDGASDKDEMGICIEDLASAMGFEPFENYVSVHPDITIYSLRKFLRLAMGGNPNLLTLLFIPPEFCSVMDARASHLQELAPKIISRKAGIAFLGYLQSQRLRLTGVRGGRDVNRPALVDAYGFDTKYAMHMLRLGYQGIELLETGKLQFPLAEPTRSWLYNVRTGKVSQDLCLEAAEGLEHKLDKLITDSSLPEQPDRAAVEAWMLNMYFENWKADNNTDWSGRRY